ncbi:hypothetical protein ACVWZ3_006240 [Bradyrhizobium sp. i1.3.6]
MMLFLSRDHLVRHDDVGEQRILLLQLEQTLLGPPVRDEGGTEILEGLATGDVVVMVVAVDDVFDRLVGDGLDGVDIGFCRTQIRDRVGRDHALRRHDEHRLVTAIAEDVDVLGAVDLFGRGLRRGLREG